MLTLTRPGVPPKTPVWDRLKHACAVQSLCPSCCVCYVSQIAPTADLVLRGRRGREIMGCDETEKSDWPLRARAKTFCWGHSTFWRRFSWAASRGACWPRGGTKRAVFCDRGEKINTLRGSFKSPYTRAAVMKVHRLFFPLVVPDEGTA